MLYRKLGRTGIEVSVLGFGCMRLPLRHVRDGLLTTLEQNKEIDEEQAIEMIHRAIAHGINYFDTAYPYHGGKSEPLLGKAVKGHREKVMIATKLPVWLVEEAG